MSKKGDGTLKQKEVRMDMVEKMFQRTSSNELVGEALKVLKPNQKEKKTKTSCTNWCCRRTAIGRKIIPSIRYISSIDQFISS